MLKDISIDKHREKYISKKTQHFCRSEAADLSEIQYINNSLQLRRNPSVLCQLLLKNMTLRQNSSRNA